MKPKLSTLLITAAICLSHAAYAAETTPPTPEARSSVKAPAAASTEKTKDIDLTDSGTYEGEWHVLKKGTADHKDEKGTFVSVTLTRDDQTPLLVFVIQDEQLSAKTLLESVKVIVTEAATPDRAWLRFVKDEAEEVVLYKCIAKPFGTATLNATAAKPTDYDGATEKISNVVSSFNMDGNWKVRPDTTDIATENGSYIMLYLERDGESIGMACVSQDARAALFKLKGNTVRVSDTKSKKKVTLEVISEGGESLYKTSLPIAQPEKKDSANK